VWKLATGQCVRKIEKAHTQGITCVNFSKDGSQVVSGSFDQLVRVFGLKTGKIIKEFRGHSSFINEVMFTPDGSRIVSIGSDGYAKVWDAKSSECLHSFRPNPKGSADLHPTPLHSLVMLVPAVLSFFFQKKNIFLKTIQPNREQTSL